LNDESTEAREARLRAQNRTTLFWIVVACLALGVLGFLFATWLKSHPPTAR
jgi:undecaprenyl pyrophosphate phosphatase UppP